MFAESIIDVITLIIAAIFVWYLYMRLCDIEDAHKETTDTLILLRQELKTNSTVIHDMHVATNKQVNDINQKLKTLDQKDKIDLC